MRMESVIVAFENSKSGQRVKEILESSGTARCVLCRSASEARRVLGKQRVAAVICGFKLVDDSAEGLFEDLPPSCAMLMVAVRNLLDMCQNDDIFKLSAPVKRGDLIASVNMLLRMEKRLEKYVRPRRSEEERAVISQAKLVLMDRHGMTEDQAHRFLQKRSMDSGTDLVQTAKLVLGER